MTWVYEMDASDYVTAFERFMAKCDPKDKNIMICYQTHL